MNTLLKEVNNEDCQSLFFIGATVIFCGLMVLGYQLATLVQ